MNEGKQLRRERPQMIGVRLTAEMLKELDEYVARHAHLGFTRSIAVRQAVEMLLWAAKKEKGAE